jgi:hypothetical protein
MRGPYDDIVKRVKAAYAIRVRRYRTAMSGCAWRVCHRDGRSINWIESPRPRTPLSLAIFLHEVGHHAIGFDRSELPSDEEYLAWKWAIDTMRRLGVEPDARTRRRIEQSMQYAVQQSVRQGLKLVPPRFHEYHQLAA